MLDNRLQTFIVLNELKNYTKTATHLHMTQPAVTQHIKYLESYYGIELFVKKKKELFITYEGELLLEYAMRSKVMANKIKEKLGNKGKKGRYSLGSTLTIGEYIIPKLLFEYNAVEPEVDISINIENTEKILKNLKNEKLDLALVEGLFNKDKYEYKFFKLDELILVASPNNEISKRESVDLADLGREKLILREKGSGTRRRFEAEIYLLGVEVDDLQYTEVGNLNATKKLVEKNMGVTIVSREIVKEELSKGSLVEVGIKDISLVREFNFVWLKESQHKEFIENFISWCREKMSESSLVSSVKRTV